MLANHYGFWSLNAVRIAYLVEETVPVKRFGFGATVRYLETPSTARSASVSNGDAKTARSTTMSSPSPDRTVL